MYVFVEENPNCGADERVFPTRGDKREVAKVNINDRSGGNPSWCDVIAVDDPGTFAPAYAQRMDDSSDGTAWLVFGGNWGLRFRRPDETSEWSMSEKSQWGLPFLVLDSSGTAIQFR